ncbi:MATE family efflux transporter [Balneatrix alpica]|uniref:MATE family efflux transporter n=1 Tax=Balneatrix alpica TaxID=75684 RepID=A0ABV5Z9S0_9GAMM|nr:MATE family efflux transporter [Balneatrix alpica]
MPAETSAHRRLWRLAWPIMLSNASVPLLGLVDTAVVGHLDDGRHLAAVALGASLFSLVFWAFGFLRMGTTSILAQAYGREDHVLLRGALLQSISLAVGLGSALILAQGAILDLGIWILAPATELLPLVQEYCQIRIWSAPATLLNYSLLGALLALQQARAPVLILLSINLSNIALDWLFAVHWQGFSAGVAWASLVAEYLGAATGLYLLRQPLASLGGHWPSWQQWRQLSWSRLLRTNRDLFIRTLCLLGSLLWFSRQGSLLGASVVAANAILLQGLHLTAYVLDGFAHALESLCGAAWGRGKKDELRALVRAATQLSLLTALAWSLVFWLAGEYGIRLLTSQPEVLALCQSYLPWLWGLPLIAVWSYLYDGVLIGTGQIRLMRDTMLIATLVYLLSWYFSQSLGNQGLWLAFWLFYLARSAGVTLVSRRLLTGSI